MSIISIIPDRERGVPSGDLTGRLSVHKKKQHRRRHGCGGRNRRRPRVMMPRSASLRIVAAKNSSYNCFIVTAND
jgi:hypothetical protein